MLTPYIKYAAYLVRHCWYVRKMCWKNGLYWQGLVHDLSKWRPSEFVPYARYFYAKDRYPDFYDRPHMPHYTGKFQSDIDNDFELAWLLHQKRNPHHWQFWIMQQDDGETFPMKMPEKYVKEMICDWWGASVATGNGGNSKDWYEKNKENTILDEHTREYFERAIQNSPTPYILPPL